MAHRWMMKLLMWPSVPQTTRCTLPVQLAVASPPFLSWIGRGVSLVVGPEKKVSREGTDDGRGMLLVFGGAYKSNCHLLVLLILDCRIAGPIVGLGIKNTFEDHLRRLLEQIVEVF